jgi:hypothetical protein
MTARTLAAAILVAFIGTGLAQPTKPKESLSQPAPQIPGDSKAEKRTLTQQLATRVNVEKFEGQFKDAVSQFATKYHLPLVLTRRGANWRGENDGLDTTAAEQNVVLPALTNVTLKTALKLLCEQTQTRFLIDPDHIRIVPDIFADYESGLLTVSNNPEEAPFLVASDLVRTRPLIKRAMVSETFKNQSLSDVLNEIAESTGATIAISPLLPANIREVNVTVRFANTPVDAAVRTLCEMTDCGVIEDANVLLVTTRERATARAKEDADKHKAKQPTQVGFPGAGLGGSSVSVDATALELAKLKEQNEQLKKQLDEIQKLLQKQTGK